MPWHSPLMACNHFVPNYLDFMSYVWWIVSTTTNFLLTRYHYFKQKPKNPLTDGLLFGILLAAITFIIEVPLIVYGFGMGLETYLIWLVWIQYLLVIISPIVAALTNRLETLYVMMWAQKAALNNISVGNIFSRSWTLPYDPNYVPRMGTYRYDGGIRSFDPRQLIRLNFVLFQKFFLFF